MTDTVEVKGRKIAGVLCSGSSHQCHQVTEDTDEEGPGAAAAALLSCSQEEQLRHTAAAGLFVTPS